MANLERDTLKEKADLMSLDYQANISTDKLRELVENAENKEKPAATKAGVVPATKRKMTPEELQANAVMVQRKELLKLRRIILTCNDKNMKAYDTTPIYSFSNSVINLPKLVVPFNVETHVPQAYYGMLKDMVCYIDIKAKDSKGRPVTRKKQVKKYNLQDIPDLTPDELKALQQAQAMRDGVKTS